MESRQWAEKLIEVTEQWFPFTINPTQVTTKDLAVAGFVRCRRLLQGMVTLHDSPDLAGLFTRSLYETWLTTVYLLLGGDDAYARLDTNDHYELQRMAKRYLEIVDRANPTQAKLIAQMEAVLKQPEPGGKRIDTRALTRAVEELLEENNDPNSEWPVTMYSAVFAPESYTGVHGGIGALKQYMLDEGSVGQQISADPWEHAGNDHRLELMTAATMALANRIANDAGLARADLDDLAAEWFHYQSLHGTPTPDEAN